MRRSLERRDENGTSRKLSLSHTLFSMDPLHPFFPFGSTPSFGYVSLSPTHAWVLHGCTSLLCHLFFFYSTGYRFCHVFFFLVFGVGFRLRTCGTSGFHLKNSLRCSFNTTIPTNIDVNTRSIRDTCMERT